MDRSIFKSFENRSDYNGGGYVGARADAPSDVLRDADKAILKYAAGSWWSEDRLFEWCNTDGKPFAELAFGQGKLGAACDRYL